MAVVVVMMMMTMMMMMMMMGTFAVSAASSEGGGRTRESVRSGVRVGGVRESERGWKKTRRRGRDDNEGLYVRPRESGYVGSRTILRKR